MPIFASSYQSGNGLESRLSQSGVYFDLHKSFDSATVKVRDIPKITMIAEVKEWYLILTFACFPLTKIDNVVKNR